MEQKIMDGGMSAQQPEALRLAQALLEPVVLDKHAMQAAAELRRLHAVEQQRDELLIAFKHIATQTGNMKFDAYQFSRSIIAKVEEKSNE